MDDKVLELQNLAISFDTDKGEVEAVRGIDLQVKKGEILCIVGESGCGKTVLCQSIMHLLPNTARVKSGKMLLLGEDITNASEKEMRAIRGRHISMVFQDPLATLNPTIPIGKQIVEAIKKHEKISNADAKARALELLQMVGIEDAANRFDLQPHFFSGGMRQRCVIAVALASNPDLIFMDEATTALDVTVEARILDLIVDICKQTGISIVFVTHDLGTVARIADRVAVMYAGKLVEVGTAEDIFYDSRHPYTWGLLSSLPSLVEKEEKLNYIPGMPPSLLDPPEGDAFAVRNKYALRIDYEQMPSMTVLSDSHSVASWLVDERAPKVEKPDYLRREKQNDN